MVPTDTIRRAWSILSRSRVRVAVGAALGLASGAAYAHFVGCKTGSCPITASVWTGALYGGVLGTLAAWPPQRR